jgi:hypothetical protein
MNKNICELYKFLIKWYNKHLQTPIYLYNPNFYQILFKLPTSYLILRHTA